jgi:hypothetical protein
MIKEHFIGDPIALSSKSEYGGHYAGDNHQIAFLSNREANHYRLWLKQNGQVSLLYNKTIGSVPQWSPQGSSQQDRLILFLTSERKMAVYNVINDKVTLHGDSKLAIDKLVWGHNNDVVYFSQRVKDQHQLFKMPLSSGKVSQLTQGGGYSMQASSDGRFLYYNKYNQRGLWRIDLTNNAHQPILPDFNPMNLSNWQLFDTGLYYIRDPQATRGLFFYSFKQQHQRQLIDNKEIYQFNVNSDQNKVLITTKKSLIGDLHLTHLVD